MEENLFTTEAIKMKMKWRLLNKRKHMWRRNPRCNKTTLGLQQGSVWTLWFQRDSYGFITEDLSWRFLLLRTNISAVAVLHFSSHRLLTETNHASNTFLTAFTVRARSALLFSPSCLMSSHCLLLHFPNNPPPLFSSFHLWRCCQSASETTGFPFHLIVRDWMRDKRGAREERSKRGEEECNDLPWWMHLARKCWHNGREAWRIDGLNTPIAEFNRSPVSVQWSCLEYKPRLFIKDMNWVFVMDICFCDFVPGIKVED